MKRVIVAPSTSSSGGSHSFVGTAGHDGSVLRTVTATRYVTPLREGGSLPGLVEADDDGLYALKFLGAGQGTTAPAAGGGGRRRWRGGSGPASWPARSACRCRSSCWWRSTRRSARPSRTRRSRT